MSNKTSQSHGGSAGFPNRPFTFSLGFMRFLGILALCIVVSGMFWDLHMWFSILLGNGQNIELFLLHMLHL